MEKPVIILGGGVWGSLLAYRLKEALPHIPFKLYEASSELGNHKMCAFRESDCKESMKWLRPLISHSWDNHQIRFKKYNKWISKPYHLIDSSHLHKVATGALGDTVVKLNNKISAELALKEASFVIDARNICYYDKTGYRHGHTVELELEENHNLSAPLVFDAKDSIFEINYMQIFPLSEKRILVNDFRHCSTKELDIDERRDAFNEHIRTYPWKIAKVIKESFSVTEVPLTPPRFRQDGRVINLAGIFHDVNGCSIPMATKLIDRMVKTSFRFGELREVVNTFRKEIETDRQFLRSLNKLLIDKKRPQVFERIYTQSGHHIENFSQGKVSFLQRYKIRWQLGPSFKGLPTFSIKTPVFFSKISTRF